MEEPTGYKDSTRLQKWTTKLLGAFTFMTAAGLLADTSRFLLDRGGSSRTAYYPFPSAMTESLWAGVYILLVVVTGIMVLKWTHRANHNARALGATGMRFSPAWSIGWYFIPVGNWWMPYLAMKEIWNASETPTDWQSTKASSLVGWWWFLWICYIVLGTWSALLGGVPLLALASSAGFTALGFVLLSLVGKVYAMQTAEHPRLSAGTASDSGDASAAAVDFEEEPETAGIPDQVPATAPELSPDSETSVLERVARTTIRPRVRVWPHGILAVVLVLGVLGASIALSGGDDTKARWEKADQLVAQGEALEAKGETEQALELYSQAIRTAPENQYTWSHKDILLRKEGRFGAALNNAEGWAKQIPKNDLAWMSIGYSLEAMGRYQEAITAYEKTLELTVDSSLPMMVETARLAERRKAASEAALNDPALAEVLAYARQVGYILDQIGEVNQKGAAFADAATSAESLKLLAEYEAGIDYCIAEATAIELPSPSNLAAVHSQLVDGLRTIKKGLTNMSAAVQTAVETGDSTAMEAANETLMDGSEKVEAYRLQLVERMTSYGLD